MIQIKYYSEQTQIWLKKVPGTRKASFEALLTPKSLIRTFELTVTVQYYQTHVNTK